jgi:hypothetical protein
MSVIGYAKPVGDPLEQLQRRDCPGAVNDLADPTLQQPGRHSDAALAGSAVLLRGPQERRHVPLAQGLADFGALLGPVRHYERDCGFGYSHRLHLTVRYPS